MSENSCNGPVTRNAKKKAEAEKAEIGRNESPNKLKTSQSDLADNGNNTNAMAIRNQQAFLQQHPLLIPVILKVLFKYQFLPEDLKHLRLVCKHWYEASLKQWRSKATVNLGTKSFERWQRLEIFWYTKCLKSSNDIYQFAQHPFQQYVIRQRGCGNNWTNKRYETFWSFIGPLVKTLRFEDCAYGNVVHQSTFMNILTKKLVNLQSLSIGTFNNRYEVFNEVDDMSYYRDAYMVSKSNGQNLSLTHLKLVCHPVKDLMILFSAPNVKVPTIHTFMNCDWPGLYTVLRNMSDAKVDVDHEQFKIQELNLNLNISKIENAAQLGRRISLPVERLFFSLQTPSSDRVFFGTGFQNLRTLKSLELCRLCRQGRPTFNFSPNGHAHLRELYLYNFCFASLETMSILHNLETLYIDIKMYNCLDRVVEATCKPTAVANVIERNKFQVIKDIITEMSPDVLPVLDAMKRFHVDQELNVESWRVVSEWMPNLETLETVLGPVAFQVVCRHLPNLKGLVLLNGSNINDKVLTGENGADRKFYNITTLLQLETFQIQRLCGIPNFQDSKLQPPSCRLGDQSVYRGFLEMKKIQNVSIHASRKMSFEAETVLRKHIPNVQVIRSYISSKNNHTRECCKVKDFLRHYSSKH